MGADQKILRGANCTLIVRELLEEGGFPQKPYEVMPWGSTPIGQQKAFEFVGAEEVTDEAHKQALISIAEKNCEDVVETKASSRKTIIGL